MKDLKRLNDPDPSIFEQLLEKANADVGNKPAIGIGPGTIVGEVAQYQHQGSSSVDWDDSDEPETPFNLETVVEHGVDDACERTQANDHQPGAKAGPQPRGNPRIHGTNEKTDSAGHGTATATSPCSQETTHKTDSAHNPGYQGTVTKAGTEFGPSATGRKRGRPIGSKDKKPRKRKKGREAEPRGESSMYAKLAVTDNEYAEMYSHLAIDEEEEELLEAEVFLSYDVAPGESEKVSRAFAEDNPYRPKWIKAKELEETRLLSYETWRKLTPQEEQEWRKGNLPAVPCALLLSRKRSGQHKALLTRRVG